MKKQVALSDVTAEANMGIGRIINCTVSFTGVISLTPSEVNQVDLVAFAKQPILVDIPLKQMDLSDVLTECIINEITARIERG